MPVVFDILHVGVVIATAFSIGYLLFALWCVTSRAPSESAGQWRAADSPGVTVIKPLCGLDFQLHENLRSFCDQDYPNFQILFVVADRDDPAIPVVHTIIAEFPDHDIQLVVDGRRIGSNFKVSNLANAYPHARYDLLASADSDMRVGRRYLQRIAECFADSSVGAATCLYVGTPATGLASRLAAMHINESFLPSVLVATRLEAVTFCFGATMVVRRKVLQAMGGFDALASLLADDYALGHLTTQNGYTVRIAPYVVENIVRERDLKSLVMHELRWARTVRTVRPVGYFFSILTMPIPLSLLTICASGSAFLGGSFLGISVTLRILLQHLVQRRFAPNARSSAWLVPLRDLLGFAVWATSFLSRDVRWRGTTFSTNRDGSMVRRLYDPS